MSYDPILKDSSIVKIWGRYISLPLVSGIESELDFEYPSCLYTTIVTITYYILGEKVTLKYEVRYDKDSYKERTPDRYYSLEDEYEIIYNHCITEETKNTLDEFDTFKEAWKSYHNKLGAINAKPI